MITLLIEEINGVRNPGFVESDGAEPDPRFAEIADLLASLHRSGALVWVTDEDSQGSYNILCRSIDAPDTERIARVYELLELENPPAAGDADYLNLSMGVARYSSGSVVIRSRSLFSLFQVAAASVDVPVEDEESGIAPKSRPGGPAVEALHNERSASRSRTAMVSVPYRGWWYSIDMADTPTKEAFRMIEAIMSARIADAAHAHNAAPVLTVPASR